MLPSGHWSRLMQRPSLSIGLSAGHLQRGNMHGSAGAHAGRAGPQVSSQPGLPPHASNTWPAMVHSSENMCVTQQPCLCPMHSADNNLTNDLCIYVYVRKLHRINSREWVPTASTHRRSGLVADREAYTAHQPDSLAWRPRTAFRPDTAQPATASVLVTTSVIIQVANVITMSKNAIITFKTGQY